MRRRSRDGALFALRVEQDHERLVCRAMRPRTTIFISYSRRDRRWLERLQVYLKPYSQRGLLVAWDDKAIKVGDDWRTKIQSAIDCAAASVLLLSADFLASDFITNAELPPLLRKAEREGAAIFPLFVGPVKLTTYPELARFHAFNVPEKPLSGLKRSRADEVLAEFAEAIAKSIPPEPADARTDAKVASAGLYARLYQAKIELSILQFLAESQGEFHLTELTRALRISARMLAHDAVVGLAHAGWIVKRRTMHRTVYEISEAGVYQLERLSRSEAPVRASNGDDGSRAAVD